MVDPRFAWHDHVQIPPWPTALLHLMSSLQDLNQDLLLHPGRELSWLPFQPTHPELWAGESGLD